MATKTKKKQRRSPKSRVRVRGFFRVQITSPDGMIEGDSGWCENVVTNQGKRYYLCDAIGSSNTSSYVGYAALGTGGAVNATATSLPGEINHGQGSNSRTPVTYSNNGSTQASFVGTFNSTNSWFTGSSTSNISNIGLYATTSATAAQSQIFCGQTFTSSAVVSNNNVNVSYTIGLS